MNCILIGKTPGTVSFMDGSGRKWFSGPNILNFWKHFCLNFIKPFWSTSKHKNDSTRGLPYQYTVHQALQIMQIHANGLLKSWPPHSAMALKLSKFTSLTVRKSVGQSLGSRGLATVLMLGLMISNSSKSSLNWQIFELIFLMVWV